MFKLVLEKAEEPDIILATTAGSSKKQESSRKKTIYFCFIDYVKAFDCVDHNKLENSERDGNIRPSDLLLPLLACGTFLIAVRPLFYHQKEQLQKNLPLLAVVMLALGSWHQYFPVPCVRHLYWAAIPAFGVFALTAQGIWGLARPKELRIGLLVLLLIPLLYCFSFRMQVLVKYFEKLPTRVTGTAPGIRGLWIFKGEHNVFKTLHSVFTSLPPEIRARGVLNHTPDGLYSALFPAPVGFAHPMFVNWGNDVYPDYGEAVEKLIQEKKCVVFTTEFTELPGYDLVFGFSHFKRPYRLFVPQN